RQSPHWEHSLLLITFDEHGGFYDHVAPPSAVPPGDTITADYVQQGFQFDQLGVRVPAIVVSAYTPRNVIDHTVYDHTSMLKTIEELFGMRSLTARDRAASSCLHLLALATPRTDAPRELPFPVVPDPALSCEADDANEDALMLRRSQLRIARER